ncbi:MAG TPA: hypothetical protein VEB21_04940 [Terriglobales bacterium]|nr:hypothetical protein [Terriglobales bacterium]
MAKKRSVEPRYEVELLLGLNKTGMYLPKNTGNWFSFRIFEGEEEIGTVTVGRGSIRWRSYNKKKAVIRNWREFAQRMEIALR